MTNRKLHTPFRLVPKPTTLDETERPIRTIAEKMRLSEPPQKNLNDDRPILLSTNMYRPMNLVSGDITFMRIFAEVHWGGASNDSGLSIKAIFSVFAGYFSETLEMRPLYCIV